MSPPRRYGGMSAEQRKQARRERLIDAGLDVFGTTGFDSSSIERLCARASVSTRYFYDEFPSREALLEAVYEDVLRAASVAGLLAMRDEDLTPPERVAVGVRAYVLVMTADPRRTRVVHHEVRLVPSMVAKRRETARWAADFLGAQTQVPPHLDGSAFVPGLAVLGAVSEVLTDWTLAPEPRPAVGPVAAELCAFVHDLVDAYLTSSPPVPPPVEG